MAPTDLAPADFLLAGFVWYLVFVFSTSLHEAAHAWSAKLLGDPTAYYGGQVTVNPLPHIQREPIGTIAVPIVSYLVGGWMIGWASAPYDPLWAARHPRRAAWMALAGPAANLLLVVIAIVLIRLGMRAGVFHAADAFTFPYVAATTEGFRTQWAELISIVFTLNFILFLFNLLPFPPLDGSAVLQLFMRQETAVRWQETMRRPHFVMFGLIAAIIVFRAGSFYVHLAALNIIYPDVGYGVD